MIPGPQKAQILDLDRAIDHVATQLTYVEDDAALAARIVASLPIHPAGFRWFISSWTFRFALIASIVIGSVLLNRSEKTSAPIPASSFAATRFVAAVHSEPIRTKPLEHVERLKFVEPVGAKPDHERSLPPLESVAALSVDSVAPPAIPDEAPLTVAPLTIEPLVLDPER
jgi:hypothetical protein